jgi:hypothetical protein
MVITTDKDFVYRCLIIEDNETVIQKRTSKIRNHSSTDMLKEPIRPEMEGTRGYMNNINETYPKPRLFAVSRLYMTFASTIVPYLLKYSESPAAGEKNEQKKKNMVRI